MTIFVPGLTLRAARERDGAFAGSCKASPQPHYHAMAYAPDGYII